MERGTVQKSQNNFFKHAKKSEEQPSEQPFDQDKNGSHFGCLASH
jgi:hypothetical protein